MASERMIVMAGTDERDLTRLAEYEAIDGYSALQFFAEERLVVHPSGTRAH